jgi:Na+/pantothenate symporter
MMFLFVFGVGVAGARTLAACYNMTHNSNIVPSAMAKVIYAYVTAVHVRAIVGGALAALERFGGADPGLTTPRASPTVS